MLSDGVLYAQVPELFSERRRLLGLTQSQVAREARVSRHFVSEVENGRLDGMALGRLLAVLNTVGLSLEVIVGIPSSRFGGRTEMGEETDAVMDSWLRKYRGDRL